jgi:D-alanyl-D-alanine carboxypeptidase/D-alanyl-D-alanine-endopeptidase (penicillin-binding protein 4)
VRVSGRLLGTKYENGPLGEGEFGGPDPDPRFDFERVDCVTYLEQALALALVGERAPADFLPTLDAIRYRGGEVSFESRNHYMALDWIPANSWLVEDVTREVGRERVRVLRRTIDRARFLSERGASARPGLDGIVTRELAYVPREAAPEVASALRSGDLVFWVGKRDDIFIAHTGMVVRDADKRDGAEFLFRHASSAAGRALDESFLAYAEGAVFAEGFVVLRLRTGARAPHPVGGTSESRAHRE